MSEGIRDLVKACPECEQFCNKPREPLICTPWPERLWWRLVMDLLENEAYLVVVAYYSRYISAHELEDSTDSKSVIVKLENPSCMLGIPNTIVSDNGPQFVSEGFTRFVAKWDISYIASLPKYPQSNGEAVRVVQI